MRTPPPADPNAALLSATAIRHLAAHGYESTTAGDLADAVGLSRSTFFRRFGGKDEVLFVDHDLALSHLEAALTDGTGSPTEMLARGAMGVLQLLTRDPEAARLRSELLRTNSSLREHESVITHRYERVFAAYLLRVAPPGTPEWAPTALAAGVVAVHNATLRRWLRDPDPRIILGLDAELRQLVARFSPWFSEADHSAARVVVAAFDSATGPDDVVTAIRAALETG